GDARRRDRCARQGSLRWNHKSWVPNQSRRRTRRATGGPSTAASASARTEALDSAAERRQFGLQFANRLCPVTDIVFHLLRKFGERFFESIWDKDRIVAESV